MFAVRTQLFSNLAPHEIGKFPSLADALAFAKTRLQFSLEIWIERAGVVVVNYDQLRRGIAPTISN